MATIGKEADTRERLLDVAEKAVLAKGFGATSIEELISEVGITKGGFFYHFGSKNELARALLQRYMEREDVVLDNVFARGRELSDDPLHAFLIGLKLLAETMSDIADGHPGCLVATYCYQEHLFDREVRELNRQIVIQWRARFRKILEEICRRHTPREEVELDSLADMISSVIEGALILERATKDAGLVSAQIMLLRRFMKLLFEPGGHDGRKMPTGTGGTSRVPA